MACEITGFQSPGERGMSCEMNGHEITGWAGVGDFQSPGERGMSCEYWNRIHGVVLETYGLSIPW